MSFKLEPKADRIIIRVDEVEETTLSGIIIPESAKERSHTAAVVAVGPGLYSTYTGDRRSLDTQVGDKIMFAKYSGTKVEVDKVEYLIIRELDIVATMRS